MKTLTLAAALLLPAAAQAATTITETFTMTTAATIPDGDLSGLVQTMTPATLIGALDFLTVTLNTTGGWNGDLYAYLWHGGEISILTNRLGRTSGNTAGSGSGGLTLTLADAATTDLHLAPGGFGSGISGSFQPDGRNFHPLNTDDTTARTAPLSVFNGDAASGDWRLFIADVATGDSAMLTGWSLTLTGTQIPEPGTALLSGVVLLGLLRRKRD